MLQVELSAAGYRPKTTPRSIAPQAQLDWRFCAGAAVAHVGGMPAAGKDAGAPGAKNSSPFQPRARQSLNKVALPKAIQEQHRDDHQQRPRHDHSNRAHPRPGAAP